MNIILNGQKYNIESNITLKQMLINLNIEQKNIIAEVNGEVVTKDDFSNKIINENDIIELVRFVGGG